MNSEIKLIQGLNAILVTQILHLFDFCP